MPIEKIRSMIVDDDESNITNLQLLLNAYCPIVNIVGTATSVKTGIVDITNLKPDLLFLDVEIKNSTGFDLLAQLENKKFNVIFVTAFHQYAIKALRFSAIDYLLKPIVIEELENAVNKVHEKMNGVNHFKELENLMNNLRKGVSTSQRLALPMNGFVDFVAVSDIYRCVGESSYTSFYFKDGSTKVVSKTLKEYEELLTEYNFLRVHKSHLVNMSYVKSFVKRDAHLIMDDGTTITVSTIKKNEILKKLSSVK